MNQKQHEPVGRRLVSHTGHNMLCLVTTTWVRAEICPLSRLPWNNMHFKINSAAQQQGSSKCRSILGPSLINCMFSEAETHITSRETSTWCQVIWMFPSTEKLRLVSAGDFKQRVQKACLKAALGHKYILVITQVSMYSTVCSPGRYIRWKHWCSTGAVTLHVGHRWRSTSMVGMSNVAGSLNAVLRPTALGKIIISINKHLLSRGASDTWSTLFRRVWKKRHECSCSDLCQA